MRAGRRGLKRASTLLVGFLLTLPVWLPGNPAHASAPARPPAPSAPGHAAPAGRADLPPGQTAERNSRRPGPAHGSSNDRGRSARPRDNELPRTSEQRQASTVARPATSGGSRPDAPGRPSRASGKPAAGERPEAPPPPHAAGRRGNPAAPATGHRPRNPAPPATGDRPRNPPPPASDRPGYPAPSPGPLPDAVGGSHAAGRGAGSGRPSEGAVPHSGSRYAPVADASPAVSTPGLPFSARWLSSSEAGSRGPGVAAPPSAQPEHSLLDLARESVRGVRRPGSSGATATGISATVFTAAMAVALLCGVGIGVLMSARARGTGTTHFPA